MADTGIAGGASKKMVKMGQKRRGPFAFYPGPKSDHIILIDGRKKPEVIAKIAKKAGTGSKDGFGTWT